MTTEELRDKALEIISELFSDTDAAEEDQIDAPSKAYF